MTADEIVGGILQREGGWRDAKTRPDGNVDPPTNRGITLPTLQAYYKQYVDASVVVTDANLRELSTDLATRIYTSMFVDAPGFTPANIPFEPLRVQLIDFGVNSGPARAVRWLQRVLRVPATGVTVRTLRRRTAVTSTSRLARSISLSALSIAAAPDTIITECNRGCDA